MLSERRPLGEFVEENNFSQSFSIHVMAWPLLIEGSPTKLRDMNVKNQRFIGRGNLTDKNYVSLVEQHKLSKEYMMQARICLYLGLYLYIEFIRICIFLLQAETFASNLRENLDRVRQTEAFKTYNATFQMLSASTNVTFDSRFWTKTTLNYPIIPIIPEPLFTIQLFQIGPILFSTFQSGLSYLKVSSSTSERQWMLWTRCGALSWRSVKKYRLNNKST